MPPRGWKYSIMDQCYMPPIYWKTMRRSLEKLLHKKRLSKIVQYGEGSKKDNKFKGKQKYRSKSVDKPKYSKSSNGNQAKDPMYTDDFEHYDPSCGLTFEQWIHKTWDKDPATRFTYSVYEARIPHQCRHCATHNRTVEYDDETDITRIVFGLCQNCRYNNIKQMNSEYHSFKKPSSDDSDSD